jgi:hypothetical protein
MERQPRRRLATSTRRCRASRANRVLHESSVFTSRFEKGAKSAKYPN